MSRRVVITGQGTVSALGVGLEPLWQATLEGHSGIGIIRRFDASGYRSQLGAEFVEFEPTERVDPKLCRRADRFTQFALYAASMALEDSGLQIDDGNRAQVGVLIGAGIGGMETWEEQFRRLLERGPARVSPFLVPMMIVDMASGLVSIATGAMGPNLAAVTACASGANAMAAAADLIKLGRARAMVTGGAEAGITPSALAGFCSAGALSVRNHDPQHSCRPFDRDRDGFVMGEGATIFVIEDLGFALERGAPILAELVGVGLSGDAHHVTEPSPDGAGAALAMQAALDDAGLKAPDLDYISAHAPGTPAGDASEAKSLLTALGDHVSDVPISSTKPIHGHMLGATGPTELALCLAAMRDGVIPHTLNCDNPDVDPSLDLVRAEPRHAPIRIAMCNSFGFGGHNVVLIVSQFSE
jgi:3-oxoacyl-[acyl-carrier-protein] synthase II